VTVANPLLIRQQLTGGQPHGTSQRSVICNTILRAGISIGCDSQLRLSPQKLKHDHNHPQFLSGTDNIKTKNMWL